MDTTVAYYFIFYCFIGIAKKNIESLQCPITYTVGCNCSRIRKKWTHIYQKSRGENPQQKGYQILYHSNFFEEAKHLSTDAVFFFSTIRLFFRTEDCTHNCLATQQANQHQYHLILFHRSKQHQLSFNDKKNDGFSFQINTRLCTIALSSTNTHMHTLRHKFCFKIRC